MTGSCRNSESAADPTTAGEHTDDVVFGEDEGDSENDDESDDWDAREGIEREEDER